MKKTDSKTPWKKIFNLIKDYFLHSDEKLVAWLLLIASALCVVGLVALVAAFTWWSAGFWAILVAKSLSSFLFSMVQFSGILAGFVLVTGLKNYFVGKLSIKWRVWLTEKTLKNLFESANNFLELKRFASVIDNIQQRIQEDVKSFVELSLNLMTNALQSTLGLVTFVSTLWVVGGALSFVLLGLNIVIPGYLVWVALIVALGAAVITHFIGKSLPDTNKKAVKAEADFRQDLVQLNLEAENIAEEHAENYYRESLEKKIQEIKKNANQKLNTQTKVLSFQSFNSQLSLVLPNLLAAPLYFSGLIEIAQLMQIAMCFSEVSYALSFYVNSFEDLANYKASYERIIELQNAFDKDGLDANHKEIQLKVRDKESLHIKRLTLMKPQAANSRPIMRNLHLKLNPDEHVLLKGPSGLGKSTLFKAISGVWAYGDGKISKPAGKNILILPQRPTLPENTLKAVLAFPKPVETYTEEQYITALKTVGEMDDFIPQLDVIENWATLFSGGQLQRISFARVLLQKPDWVLLDEATSALDEPSEAAMYDLVTNLPGTTVVSIAHRSTIEKFHSKIVFFKANEEREVTTEERMPNISASV